MRRPVGCLRPFVFGVCYLVLVALLVHGAPPRLSGNVWSRYMTAESIVERHTLAVDGSPWLGPSGTPDLVKFRGRLYSDKPPVLSAIAAGLYWPLHGIGMSFVPPGTVTLNLVLVVALVGVSSASCLVWFRKLLQFVDLPRAVSDFLTVLLGLGTLLMAYAVTFNNHSVAAGLLTGSFYMVCSAVSRKRGKDPSGTSGVAIRAASAGLLVATAAVIDMPAGALLAVGLGVWVALGLGWKPLGWYALAAVFPLLLHAALQTRVSGTPLPAELTPEAFEYSGSYWATEQGKWHEPGPRWQFGLEFLFGPQGWVTMTPILAFGVFGAIRLLWEKHPLWPGAAILGVAVTVLVTYYTWGVRRTDFAGQSYGCRHMLAITPLCMFLTAAAMSRLRARPWQVLFLACSVISLGYAVRGMPQPWTRVEQRVEVDPTLALLQKLVPYPWSSYRR